MLYAKHTGTTARAERGSSDSETCLDHARFDTAMLRTSGNRMDEKSRDRSDRPVRSLLYQRVERSIRR
jgi:hypothetical protein